MPSIASSTKSVDALSSKLFSFLGSLVVSNIEPKGLDIEAAGVAPIRLASSIL